MADAGADEVGVAPEAGEGVVQVAAQVPQGQAAAVAEPGVLEVVLHA
jgi:hypothetical protein